MKCSIIILNALNANHNEISNIRFNEISTRADFLDISSIYNKINRLIEKDKLPGVTVIAIHFIGTLYYRLVFCFAGYLMSNFIIKRKHSEKSHFLYREYLRVGSDLMVPAGSGSGSRIYCDRHAGGVGSESRKSYLPTLMTRPDPQFDKVYVNARM